jgi:diguanylate cyclase (GGDEF)-like protein
VLKVEYVSGEHFRLFSMLQIPLGQGISGWVAENRKPKLNGDPTAELGYLADQIKFARVSSALSIPLTGLTGVVSVLTLYHADTDAFTPDHLRILMAIATKLGHSIENALKYQQAESSASTDYMTGLPNARSLFLHLDGELARSRRLASSVMVLVCDLNGFKGVNDRFGHLEGNRLLRVLAGKVKECCREYDYVARMGGDEFVLVLPTLRMDQAKSTMKRLNSAAQEAGREVCGIETLSLSIGAAIYPEDGAEGDQLLSQADSRMYLAKQKQKLRLVEPRGFDFDETMAGVS